MATTKAITARNIVLDERGVAYIEGTTTKVIEVVLNQESSGDTPKELAENMPHLSYEQVCAALHYYDKNKQELDDDIEKRKKWADEQAAQAGESPFVKRMKAEGRWPI